MIDYRVSQQVLDSDLAKQTQKPKKIRESLFTFHLSSATLLAN